MVAPRSYKKAEDKDEWDGAGDNLLMTLFQPLGHYVFPATCRRKIEANEISVRKFCLFTSLASHSNR